MTKSFGFSYLSSMNFNQELTQRSIIIGNLNHYDISVDEKQRRIDSHGDMSKPYATFGNVWNAIDENSNSKFGVGLGRNIHHVDIIDAIGISNIYSVSGI